MSNSNLQINTRVRRLFSYLEDFERGIIQVPPFQRDFVWSNEKKIELMDSLKNGYPIGSVLFWQPDSEVSDDLLDEEIQTIGSYSLKKKSSNFYYILDGYQRLSTLFGCFIDPQKTNLNRNEKEWKNKFDIVYNLKTDSFEFNRKTKTEIQPYQIPLYHFIDGVRFYDFQTDLMNSGYEEEEKREYIKKYKNFGSKISSFDIPSIDLVGGTIKDAVDIFSRLNSRGEQLSDDWKVSALSFSKERNFRFGTEIDKLFIALEQYNFFTSKDERKNQRKLILQCVLNSFGKVYFDFANTSKELEELAQKDIFIETARSAFHNIEKATDFLYHELLIIDGKLLPYSSQLIFLTDFFNKVNKPTSTQIEKLKRWIWVTSYSNYFTTNLTKHRFAYNRFQEFINNENADLFSFEDFQSIKFPQKINMTAVRSKTLCLFLLNYQTKFLPIYFETIRGYKKYKLFNEIEDSSENTVLIIEDYHISINLPRPDTDLSFWLESDEDHSLFFLTIELKDLYRKNQSRIEILKRRRELIMIEEERFVKTLDIKYNV